MYLYVVMSVKVFGIKGRLEVEVVLNMGILNIFVGGRFCLDVCFRYLDVL